MPSRSANSWQDVGGSGHPSRPNSSASVSHVGRTLGAGDAEQIREVLAAETVGQPGGSPSSSARPSQVNGASGGVGTGSRSAGRGTRRRPTADAAGSRVASTANWELCRRCGPPGRRVAGRRVDRLLARPAGVTPRRPADRCSSSAGAGVDDRRRPPASRRRRQPLGHVQPSSVGLGRALVGGGRRIRRTRCPGGRATRPAPPAGSTATATAWTWFPRVLTAS